MFRSKQHEFRPEDYAVRPLLRVIGALLAAFVAWLFASTAQRAFYLAAVAPEQCKSVKGRLLCEAGNWINSITPPALQGPLAALAFVCMALLMALVVWLLLKPLFIKPRKKEQ
jgi:hypothetical protein